MIGSGRWTLAQAGVGLAQDATDVASSDDLGLWDWLTAGLILVGGMIVAGVASKVVRRTLNAAGHGAIARIVGRAVMGVVVAVALIYALNSVDVRIGPILGFLGVGGIALAFALQDILENFIAGILLQVRTPFWIGDQIRTNGVEGTVEDINLRAVVVKTFDGRRVVVPSAMVLKNEIGNDTAFEDRRTEIPVGVSYDASIADSRRLIVEAAAQSEHVLDDPEPKAFVTELAASAVNFSLHVWHRSERAHRWQVVDDVIERVKDALDEAGIGIPYDQVTLHVPDGVKVRSETPTRSNGREGHAEQPSAATA